VRRAVVVALLVVASCDAEAPPLPAGALKLPRDGTLRAGAAEVPDPVPLLRARAAEGPVSVELDADVPVDCAQRLFSQAGTAGLSRMDVTTGAIRVTWRYGAAPAASPPGVSPTAPDVTRRVEGVEVVGRPSRAELRLRVAATAEPGRVAEAAAAVSSQMPQPAVVFVLEAPRAMTWGQVAPHVAAVAPALGERLVRTELVVLP
jgi:hypothetical protein